MFSTEIEDRSFVLETASDVALFSFMVQDSLSYLDLKVCKNSRAPIYSQSLCDGCRSTRLRLYVNTEEKCRQFCVPKRRLLYTLNLDLPKGRESSLKHDSRKYLNYYSGCCRSLHIASIRVSGIVHRDVLTNIIKEAVSFNVPKEKILKWLIKIPFHEVFLFYLLDIRTASIFIDCFYPEVTDSELFSVFLKHFDIVEWIAEYEQPEILEFLLYHAYRLGNISLEYETDFELVTDCTYFKHYLNIRPILNYVSDSSLTCSDDVHHLLKKSSERPRIGQDAIDEAMESLSRNRKCLSDQIIWAYLHDRPEAASEALRLIWSSVPDACITFGELGDAYKEIRESNEEVFREYIELGFREEELTKFFDFYVEAIGEFHEYVEPRSLKHLCRTVLRRTFRKNDLWIPDAISRTGLPKSLQAFLNLEKPFAT